MQGRNHSTRTRLIAALILLGAGATGCRTMSRGPVFQTGPAAPQVLAPTSTAEQVIAAVNQNTARVHSYVTNNASISMPGLPHLPLLQGNIAYERPLRFRLTARALTGPEVDLGSNDERFWLWARQMKDQSGQSPLYTVRHSQYVSSGARNMMPIEPQWIIESLGLVTITPGSTQPPIPKDGQIEVRSLISSPRGQLTRVLVVNMQGQVTEQSLIDPRGQLLASAQAEQFRFDPATQTSLPRVVTLRVPEAELALRIDTGTVAINTSTGDPNLLWQPPVIPNSPAVDLGLMQPVTQTPAPVHPMQVNERLTPLQRASPVTPAGWQQPSVATSTSGPSPIQPDRVDPAVNGFAPPQQPVVAPRAPSVYQLPPSGVVLPAAG